jgi:putative ABC transport system permease protein
VVPVSMMRNVSRKVKFSKLFFTVQFFVSITLCVCSITIIKQMKFVETAPLGFNRNIIQLNTPRDEATVLIPELKNRIAQIPGVEHVAQSAGNPVAGNMVRLDQMEDGSSHNIYLFEGDNDLIRTLDLVLVKGSIDFQTSHDKVVNETYLKTYNIKDPIGASIRTDKDSRIIGVVKDFMCASFKQEVPPVVISQRADRANLLIDYGQNDLTALIPKLQAAWKGIFPDENFEFKTIQDDLMKKYSEESLFYKVVLAASITSMIISCFGLFALSWAVIQSRAKEMGIRKVLGASVANILSLLTLSFTKRLLLAFVLAAPAGYYLMDLWLSRFVYKVPIDSWVFVYTGIVLATITVVTLAVQTLKASVSSPLKEIRE